MTDYRQHVLLSQEELRVEILDPTQPVTVKLTHGQCESFGANLTQHTDYTLQSIGGYSFFTWSGCTIEVVGVPHLQYTSRDTSYPIYANINYELEKDRQQSAANQTEGPNLLILGNRGVGKTAIARTLCHYGLRFGWIPLYVDINPAYNNLSLPGTLTASPIEQQSTPTHLERFGQIAPLVFYYGHESITANYPYYKQLCASLRHAVQDRILSDSQRSVITPGLPVPPQHNLKNQLSTAFLKRIKFAGSVIDAPAEILDLPNATEVITDLCDIFNVNIVLVVDNESLHARLLPILTAPARAQPVALARIPRSLGSVRFTEDFRHQLRDQMIRRYFYGSSKSNFSNPATAKNPAGGVETENRDIKALEPTTFYTPCDQYNFYTTSQQDVIPQSTLPLGQQQLQTSTQLHQITPDALKPNSLLAISYHTPQPQDEANTLQENTHEGMRDNASSSPPSDGADIATQPVLGFVLCTGIDSHPRKNYQRAALLYPNGFPPRYNSLLFGSITWTNTDQ